MTTERPVSRKTVREVERLQIREGWFMERFNELNDRQKRKVLPIVLRIQQRSIEQILAEVEKLRTETHGE